MKKQTLDPKVTFNIITRIYGIIDHKEHDKIKESIVDVAKKYKANNYDMGITYDEDTSSILEFKMENIQMPNGFETEERVAKDIAIAVWEITRSYRRITIKIEKQEPTLFEIGKLDFEDFIKKHNKKVKQVQKENRNNIFNKVLKEETKRILQDDMIGSSAPTAPNKHYKCDTCGKDLGTHYDRLKGKKQANANIVDGKTFCDKHYDEYLSSKKKLKEDVTLQKEYPFGVPFIYKPQIDIENTLIIAIKKLNGIIVSNEYKFGTKEKEKVIEARFKTKEESKQFIKELDLILTKNNDIKKQLYFSYKDLKNYIENSKQTNEFHVYNDLLQKAFRYVNSNMLITDMVKALPKDQKLEFIKSLNIHPFKFGDTKENNLEFSIQNNETIRLYLFRRIDRGAFDKETIRFTADLQFISVKPVLSNVEAKFSTYTEYGN